MNPDKRFANKLRRIIECAEEAAKKAAPENRAHQMFFIHGWLCTEAGIREDENAA